MPRGGGGHAGCWREVEAKGGAGRGRGKDLGQNRALPGVLTNSQCTQGGDQAAQQRRAGTSKRDRRAWQAVARRRAQAAANNLEEA